MFKTKFPFFDFFYQIMSVLLNSIKLERIQVYPDYELDNNYEGYLRKFDSRLIEQAFNGNIQGFLNTFAKAQCPLFEKSLTIFWGGIRFTMTVPKPIVAENIEAKFGISAVARHFSWSNFLSICAAVLQERRIIFVNKSRELLSKTILFFTNIIKPFLWHFPVIYFLDRSNFELLDSIVPLIVGVDLTKKKFRSSFNLSKISNTYLTYFIEDDSLEMIGEKLELPSFGGSLDKIERRYKKIQKSFSTTTDLSANREALLLDFLLKTKNLIETTCTDPLKNPAVLNKSFEEIKVILKKKSSQDEKFLEKLCATQSFSFYLDRAREEILPGSENHL